MGEGGESVAEGISSGVVVMPRVPNSSIDSCGYPSRMVTTLNCPVPHVTQGSPFFTPNLTGPSPRLPSSTSPHFLRLRRPSE